MIVEYIRYRLDPARGDAFEQAYATAQEALATSPHCLAYEVTRCVEDPSSYIVRIEWDSQDGHLQGFRTSPEFRSFFAAVRPFVNDIQEMRHYQRTSIQGAKPAAGERE
jgi:quinol monooxygenase YgiN